MFSPTESASGWDLSVWLNQLLRLINPEEGRDFHWVAQILVNRAIRLSRRGVTIVFVADRPVTSPVKQLERERRKRAKAGLSVMDEEAFPDPGVEAELSELTRVAAPASEAEVGEADESMASPEPTNVHGEFQDTVIAALREAGFVVVIAPAEADHQLSHLFTSNKIDGVITVDSDLLIMGVTIYTRVRWMDGGCIRIVASNLWKPPAQDDLPDPLRWLVSVNDKRGPEVARAAWLLYGCVVKSDFNHIPHVGRGRAPALLEYLAEEIPRYDQLNPLDLCTFITTRMSVVVQKEHALHAKSNALSLDQVIKGMMTAFTSYTRSLCYDAELRVERPLTGLAVQTPEEIAIVGRACTVAEDATDLYFGVRARAMHVGDEYPPVDPPPCMRSVRLRGQSIAIPLVYTMLPRVLHPIFELPEAALDVDLTVPDFAVPTAFPGTINQESLKLFFKCVGERLPDDQRVESLRRHAIRWVKQHRTDLADTDEDYTDLADAHAAALRPKFGFEECQLRDPLGKTAFTLAVEQGLVAESDFVHEHNKGEYALPEADSPGWLGDVRTWAAHPRGPPLCESSVLTGHYIRHYPNSELPADSEEHCRALCRPVYRALNRMKGLAERPDFTVHDVRRTSDGEHIAFLRGNVPASQTSNLKYHCKCCVRVVPVVESMFTGMAGGAGDLGSSGSSDQPQQPPIRWAIRDVLWVECPCKQNWNCAHVACLLWIIVLWGAVHVKAHADEGRYELFALGCWWMGLDPGAEDAHARQARTTPAWQLDLEGMRFGLAAGDDGRKVFVSGPAWDYDPTGSTDYPKRGEWDMEKLFELYEAIADDVVKPGASKTTAMVGMCANQFLFEGGGAFLAANEGARRRMAESTPEGARMQRHMALHATRLEGLKEASRDAQARRRESRPPRAPPRRASIDASAPAAAAE
mmetsp:Transcript_9574/g.27981  ORF Transcript_9574/g.27981 Transcript_9574/m.27981 type:complete len:922 (-) Transcript_9574:96-2861(-)